MFLPEESAGIRRYFEDKRVYCIANGSAGGVKANGFAGEFEEMGIAVSSDAQDSSLFAAQVADQHPTLVPILGGDGTLEVVVEALIREFEASGKSLEDIPLIYSCPLGTENKLAAELKLPGHRLHPRRHKRALLGLLEYVAAMHDGHDKRRSFRRFRTVPITVMKVTLDEGIHIRPLYVFDFGYGIGSRLVSSGYGIHGDDFDPRTGKLKANVKTGSSIMSNIGTFFKGCVDVLRKKGIATPVNIDTLAIQSDTIRDKEQYDKITSYGGFVSTVRELLFGFSPFYAVRYGSGEAQTIVVQSHPGWLIPQIPSMYFGWKLHGDVLDTLSRTTEFTFAQPEIVQAAGELYRVEKVTIETMREPLHFVTRQSRGYLEKNVAIGRKAQYF